MTSKKSCADFDSSSNSMNMILRILEKIEHSPPKWAVTNSKAVRRGARFGSALCESSFGLWIGFAGAALFAVF